MKGASVLLFHSIGLDGSSYESLRRALPASVNLHVPDQRGHGALAALTDFTLGDLVSDAYEQVSLARGPLHLVGHSLGGCIAALTAARAGSCIASLTLVATPPRGLPLFGERAEQMVSDPSAAAASMLARWFPQEISKDYHSRELAKRSIARSSRAGIASAWRALASFGGYDGIMGPLPPTLCIAGALDSSTPPAAMSQIVATRRANHPGEAIELVAIEGAGHMVPLTHPDELASLLAAWWGFPLSCLDRSHA